MKKFKMLFVNMHFVFTVTAEKRISKKDLDIIIRCLGPYFFLMEKTSCGSVINDI